jgi:hypothetical protein
MYIGSTIPSSESLVAVGESLAAAIALPPALTAAIAMPPAAAAAFTKWGRTLATATAAVRRSIAWRQRHALVYMRALWELLAAGLLDRFRGTAAALRRASRPPSYAALLDPAAVALRVNRLRAPESRIASLVALVATRPVHGPPAPSL